jgi:hypothetical protein
LVLDVLFRIGSFLISVFWIGSLCLISDWFLTSFPLCSVHVLPMGRSGTQRTVLRVWGNIPFHRRQTNYSESSRWRRNIEPILFSKRYLVLGLSCHCRIVSCLFGVVLSCLILSCLAIVLCCDCVLFCSVLSWGCLVLVLPFVLFCLTVLLFFSRKVGEELPSPHPSSSARNGANFVCFCFPLF